MLLEEYFNAKDTGQEKECNRWIKGYELMEMALLYGWNQ